MRAILLLKRDQLLGCGPHLGTRHGLLPRCFDLLDGWPKIEAVSIH
jgi:hypothetical protein